MKIPKPGNESEIKVDFETMDHGGSGVIPANISCLLRAEEREVSAEWVAGCKSPQRYDLKEGRYVFNVRAVDRAGLHSKPNVRYQIFDQWAIYLCDSKSFTALRGFQEWILRIITDLLLFDMYSTPY